MSKHNHTQSYKKEPIQEFKMEVENTETVEMIEPMEAVDFTPVVLVEESVETVALPETVSGIVINCTKLNVRAEPNMTAEVLCVLDASSEIEIDPAKSTSEWVSVCTAVGIEGYCMRKFIDARL